MPIYRFDVREGDSLLEDEEGRELSSPELAEQMAVAAACQILAERPYGDRAVSVSIREDVNTVSEVTATVRIHRKLTASG